MENQGTAYLLLQIFPIVLMSVWGAIVAYLLAKDKGRNVAKWVILGVIPGINFVCIVFFIGAANLRLERKVDDLLARLDVADTGRSCESSIVHL